MIPRIPKRQSTQERLRIFDAIPKPTLLGETTIHWNKYQIPYIEAEYDHDAAFAMGLVHAHLRLAQIEIGKRIAYGRLSECMGPWANDIDAGLRALDITRAVGQVVNNMPEDSKNWLSAFVEGINHYKKHIPELPHEMQLLGMGNEPWSMENSFALGRMGGVDVNWLVLTNLLPLYDTPKWPALWERIRTIHDESYPSFMLSQKGDQYIIDHNYTEEKKLAILKHILSAYARSGSNSFAVSGAKTKSGAPMIANDPHLNYTIPNLWLIAGLKCPSYQTIGIMAQGLPVFAFGRNKDIAWGGTNMRQEASDLVDVSYLRDFEEVTHEIKTRFWFTKKVKNRWHKDHGPVMSDVKILPFPKDKDIAIKWTGHLLSDEITALLGFAKAKTWQDMHRAAKDFSVPGQNFVFATASGNIGQILATWVPKRPDQAPEDIFVSPQKSLKSWQDIYKGDRLPHIVNPESGVIASANNKPFHNFETRTGWLFPVDDRVIRLYQLLDSYDNITLEEMKAFQWDVYSVSHDAVKVMILEMAHEIQLTPLAQKTLSTLAEWDGHFSVDSREACVYQDVFIKLSESFYQKYPQNGDRMALSRIGFLPRFLKADMQHLGALEKQELLNNALEGAAPRLSEKIVWGDIHRLNVQHIFARLPFLGKQYFYHDLPVPGHDATVFKTSGDITGEKHKTIYGSQSRHISDLSDINENYFVLFGGQDGFINSENYLDQVPLWSEGELIKIPFDLDKISDTFTHRSRLGPSMSERKVSAS